MKSVGDLSGGDGKERGGKFYGRSARYGRDHFPPVSARQFYDEFRFKRQDMGRLCRALRIPPTFVTPSRCVCDGEEALLIFLKVTPS